MLDAGVIINQTTINMYQIIVNKIDGDKTVQELALLRPEFNLDEFLKALTARRRGRKAGKAQKETSETLGK